MVPPTEKSVDVSIGFSIGKIDTSSYRSAISNPSMIPSVFLMVNRSCHCTGLSFWIRRWFRLKKPPRQNFHVKDPPFFLILNFLSVIQSVILTSNYRQKYFVGKSVAIKQISGSDSSIFVSSLHFPWNFLHSYQR